MKNTIFFKEENNTTNLRRKIEESLRNFDCFEDVDGEALQQWISKDSKLGCSEVLNRDDILSVMAYGYINNTFLKK